MVDLIIGFFQNYASTILSVCAITLTIQQGLAIRRHNKLSVKPLLTIFTHQQRYPHAIVVESVLHNNGLGPAYIKSFQYYYGTEAIVASDPGQVYEAVQRNNKLQVLNWNFVVLKSQYVMGKDSSQRLAHMTLSYDPQVTEEELDKYHVRIVYESLYGDSYTYDSRRHD